MQLILKALCWLTMVKTRLQGNSPIIEDSEVTGLVIDDFFSISRNSARSDDEYLESKSVASLRKAKHS